MTPRQEALKNAILATRLAYQHAMKCRFDEVLEELLPHWELIERYCWSKWKLIACEQEVKQEVKAAKAHFEEKNHRRFSQYYYTLRNTIHRYQMALQEDYYHTIEHKYRFTDVDYVSTISGKVVDQLPQL